MCYFFLTIFVPDCLKLLFMSNIKHQFNLLSVLKALGDELTGKNKRRKLKKATITHGMERKAVNRDNIFK